MTPELILAQAVSLSGRALTRQAAWGGEGLDAVDRALRAVCAFGARFNPAYFGSSRPVELDADKGGWLRPADAELIYWIETPKGERVIPVSVTQRRAESGLPAVYREGQVFYSAGNPSDPTEGPLVFRFARRPATPAELDKPVDPIFPVAYGPLLNYEVAVDFAVKDGRADDLASLVPARNRWATLFAAHLEHETIGERRLYADDIQILNAEAQVAPFDLLAGGGGQ